MAAVAAPVVAPVTAEDIRRELDWQAPRLQFNETSLADAVAEFNRLNRHQLVIADPVLNALRIGGTFRPDNVEGFVRLLATTLEVRAEPAGADRTILRRDP
jgi:transmembrane sensor